MAANINDLVSKVSTGTQRPVSTTVQSSRAAAGTSLSCGDLTGWATDTVVHFQTYKLNGEGKITPGSQTDFKGIVTANTINSVTLTGGTDAGNQVGDVVVALPTADWAFKMAEHALVAHNQDGTIKDGAVTTNTLASGIALPANTVTTAAIATDAVETAKIKDAAVTPAKRSGGFKVGSTGSITTTGSKVITGVGFKPKFVRFIIQIGATSGNQNTALGATDGTNIYSITNSTQGASSYQYSSSTVIRYVNSSGSGVCSFIVASFDTDGFTLNVTEANASTTWFYEAYA